MTTKKKTKKTSAARVYVSRGPSLPIPIKNSKEKKAKINWKNPTKFEILEDVPLPWTRVHVRDIVFPFEGMKVGHSFQFMREKDRGQNVYSASVSYCKQPEHFHKKFVIRKIKEEVTKGIEWTTWGCWREEDLSPEELTAKRRVIDEQQKIAAKKRRATRIK